MLFLTQVKYMQNVIKLVCDLIALLFETDIAKSN